MDVKVEKIMGYLDPETVRTFEERDIQYVIPFLERYGNEFSRTGATEQGVVFDIWTKNVTGGTGVIEAKCRERDYSTVFIEPDKLARLIAAYERYGAWSYYANFVKETGELLVFFIPVIKEYIREFGFRENVRINGPDGPKVGDRFEIPKKFAYIFKDGKVERPSWTEGRYRVAAPRDVEVATLADELRKIKWERQNQGLQ